MIGGVAKKILNMSDAMAIGKAIAQMLDLRELSQDLSKALTERVIKQKDLVVDVMAKEFSQFLAKLDVAEETKKILDGLSVRIEATVHFDEKKNSKSTAARPKTSSKKKTNARSAAKKKKKSRK